MTQWDGKERRLNDRDHDVLTRIDANLSNFMSRFDKHTETFDEHIKKDSDDFKSVNEKLDDTRKYIWMAVGGIFVLEMIISFIKK